MLGLRVNIDDSRHFRLHAVSEFIAFHAGSEICVLGMVVVMLLIEEGKLIECAALMLS